MNESFCVREFLVYVVGVAILEQATRPLAARYNFPNGSFKLNYPAAMPALGTPPRSLNSWPGGADGFVRR
jgi:hypothetical protein